MPTLRFTKKAKLIKTDEFSSVFNFRKRISARFLVVHYQPNTITHARLGLVVGKKIAKLSHNSIEDNSIEDIKKNNTIVLLNPNFARIT